LARNQDTVSE